MLQGEHSAILSTFIVLPCIKIFGLSIFEWPFYIGFTVLQIQRSKVRTLQRHCAVPLNMELLTAHGIRLQRTFPVDSNVQQKKDLYNSCVQNIEIWIVRTLWSALALM